VPPDTSALRNLNSLISIFSSYYSPFKGEPRITDSEVIGLRERYRDNNAGLVFVFFSAFLFFFCSLSHSHAHVRTHTHTHAHTLSFSFAFFFFKFVSMRSSCVSPKDFKATAPESKQHPAVYAREANSQWREKRSSEKIRKRDLSCHRPRRKRSRKPIPS
jgi:hypothetical protein